MYITAQKEAQIVEDGYVDLTYYSDFAVDEAEQ